MYITGKEQKCNWGHENAMNKHRSVTGAWFPGLLERVFGMER